MTELGAVCIEGGSMGGWRSFETRLIYHSCGGRVRVSKLILRGGGKAVYQQRGWDAIGEAVGVTCPGCGRAMERADLIDLTIPADRGAALRAFQRVRKRARKAAAAAEDAQTSTEPPATPVLAERGGRDQRV